MKIIPNMIFLAALVLGLTATSIHGSTDQDIFTESVMAGRTAEQSVQWYIFSEVAQAQAEHGYYADALGTLRLVDKYPDQLFIKLVSTRARKGDIGGARDMAAASTAELKLRAEEAIAIIQAENGDFDGARATSRDLTDKSKSNVLEAIGFSQIKSGDLEGALKTADEMKPGANDGVLYWIAQVLEKRGDHQRALQIAKRISNPDIAQSVPGIPGFEASPPFLDLCGKASNEAKSGRSAEAYKLAESANCKCETVAFIHEDARDAVGAERAMRSCPNPADVSAGMAKLAKQAAAQGDIQAALKFADSVHITGARYEEGYFAPALRDIGRGWSEKGDWNNALAWARSRPEGYQRAMALLGVAESVSSSGSKP